MKKIIALLLALCMVACMFVGCAKDDTTDPTTTEPTTTEGTVNNDTTTEPTEDTSTEPAPSEYKVAMITDYGDITDQSFNQTTYEACLAFAEANGVEFQYYKPQTNDTAARVAMTEMAIAEGYNVIVMPGKFLLDTFENLPLSTGLGSSCKSVFKL